MFPLYFHIDANIGNKKSCRKYVAVQGGPPLKSTCILWLHKYLDPFVINLCHARGHKPTSVLLVSTMWYDGGENVVTTEKYEKTLELEEIFSKGCQLCNTLDPVFSSV